MKGKKYGLVMPGKANALTRANPLQNSKMSSKPSIFGQDSSDSGGEEGTDWVKKSLQANREKTDNSGLKKQAKIVMAKALEEDPTVFQYDEVYDDIEKKKEDVKESKKDVDRKPKYMTALLKSADERQKEFERRIERQVQKEREAEGEQFADKESFVTSAYRKKMEEIAKQEEEQARIDRIEAALDVTKQRNMDGFYRHLYRQTMGEEKGQVEDKVKKEETEDEEAKAARIKEEINKIKIEEEVEEEKDDGDGAIKKINRNKEFRKKDIEESSSESDSSGNEDDESDDDNDARIETAEDKMERRKIEMKLAKEKRERRKRRIDDGADSSDSEHEESVEEKKAKVDTVPTDDKSEVEVVKNDEPIIPKVDIWKKRTVGKLFDDAVARYWERRAVRESKGA